MNNNTKHEYIAALTAGMESNMCIALESFIDNNNGVDAIVEELENVVKTCNFRVKTCNIIVKHVILQ